MASSSSTAGEWPFGFPFPPYKIQEDLMQQLQQTLHRGHVGIFESPTGTGKSLSLLCGALTWLESATKDCSIADPPPDEDGPHGDGGTASLPSSSAPAANDGEPDWVSAFDPAAAERESMQARDKERRERLSARLAAIRKGTDTEHRRFKRQRLAGTAAKLKAAAAVASKTKPGVGDEHEEDTEHAEDALALEEYHSSDSDTGGGGAAAERGGSSSSSGDDSDDDAMVTQIIFCSRTHSQLAQFVAELKKTQFAERIRCVTLGSRKSLCVNPAVLRLGSDARINDKCRDLQKQKSASRGGATKSAVKGPAYVAVGGNAVATAQAVRLARRTSRPSASACPFYTAGPAQRQFRDTLLSRVRDIEETRREGESAACCAYYGARRAMPLLELVAVPYNMVLHRATRTALGLRLRGNVLICDEAHNIIEAINEAHSETLARAQVARAHAQLSDYQARYRHRLAAKNSTYISRILRILRLLDKFLSGGGHGSSGLRESRVFTTNGFLSELSVENINLLKINHYMEKSRIAQKIMGFVHRQARVEAFTRTAAAGGPAEVAGDQGGAEFVQQHVSVLSVVHRFLMALMNADADGRVIVMPAEEADPGARRGGLGNGNGSASSGGAAHRATGELAVRFVMMNPAVHFREVVDEARAVVLAGGTMHPMAFVAEQLFSHVPKHRVDLFTCGHIVPPENLLGVAVKSGPTGVDFDFRFEHRATARQMDELGKLVANVCNSAPGGVVVFLPSYKYLDEIYAHWRKSGVIARVQQKKRVFREPKSSAELADVLRAYTGAVNQAGRAEAEAAAAAAAMSGSVGCGAAAAPQTCVTGAILLSVVGGKMSEGINFSDALARVVVMVGLPYPNSSSPELREKMAYLDAQATGRGREYYENLCMRAVNQSIGRAIRHRADYACILLVDSRYYSNSAVRAKLPGWIVERLALSPTFGHMFGALSRFFRGKREVAKLAAASGGQ